MQADRVVPIGGDGRRHNFDSDAEAVFADRLRHMQQAEAQHGRHFGVQERAEVIVLGRRLRPDFVIMLEGRCAAIELDGPHHRGRRANDATKDRRLELGGCAFVVRVPVEATGDPAEIDGEIMYVLGKLRQRMSA